MSLLIITFIAGILSSLAPCVLPLIPVIIGGTLTEAKSKYKPFIITGSLFVSLVLFTVLLKASTVLIGVPPEFWKIISGGIILVFGIITIWPHIWEKLAIRLNLSSNAMLNKGFRKKSFVGDILIGASLGPVFSSCSPVYAVILATVLPQGFFKGLLYIISYSLGLALSLLLFARFGQSLIQRFAWISNPEGWFKRILGTILVLVGLSIITGYNITVQKYLLNHGYLDTTKLERRFIQ
jgi:cytochrome c-type biogenesis protein